MTDAPVQSPRPHRMMPVKTPQILQRIAADNATRAYRKAELANVTMSGFQAYAPPSHKMKAPGQPPEWYTSNTAPFYVNVYQLSPGRHFFGVPSAEPICSNHAVYRLRITPKAGVSIRGVVGRK